MNFFGFGSPPEIEIFLDGEDARKTAEIMTEDGKIARHILYYDGETVSGKVKVTQKKSHFKFEHQGIRIELIGHIELYYDRGTQHTFLNLYKDLARPGELLQTQTFSFEFANVTKPYESYTGTNCMLRYFLRLSIMKRLTDVVKVRELIVHQVSMQPALNTGIKMEVGIEDCLHIEFEYNRSKFHLRDVIVGKIFFLLVRIKVKHMELTIIRRETTGSGASVFNENDTIARFEIMDGAPVRGESIPIRVFLGGYNLTPTFRDVNRKFSVRYYLNLVLVDEEDRRYFKQQEIILWRKLDKPRTAPSTFQQALQQQHREMQNPALGGVVASPSSSASFSERSSGSIFPSSKSDESLSAQASMASMASTSFTTPAAARGQSEELGAASLEAQEADRQLARSIAAMSISGSSGNKEHDESTDMGDVKQGETSRKKSDPSKDGGEQGIQVFEHDDDVNGNQSQDSKSSCSFAAVILAAGLSRTLSGDNSDDDDDKPTLTGSICQADVHYTELATDAAAALEEKYEYEQVTDGEEKYDGTNIRKEE